MTWNGKKTFIEKVDTEYVSGVKVGKSLMKLYEKALERDEQIGKWLLEINPLKCKEVLDMVIKV